MSNGILPQTDVNRAKIVASTCGNKIQYASQEQAEIACYDMYRKHADGNLHPYKCHVCGHFHVGHEPKRNRGDAEPTCACGHAASIHLAYPASGCAADECVCLGQSNIIYKAAIFQHRQHASRMKEKFEFIVAQLPSELLIKLFATKRFASCHCPVCDQWRIIAEEISAEGATP